MEGQAEQDGVRVVEFEPGPWQRTWEFFIWKWTITTWDADQYVETVQRRFLGTDVVRTHSKTVWLLMAWSTVLVSVAAMAGLLFVAYVMAQDGSFRAAEWLFFIIIGLMIVAGATAVAYFTFVPPKATRDQRRRSG
jgi:type III secretory pathway component EscS